jgi:hypothetical protein
MRSVHRKASIAPARVGIWPFHPPHIQCPAQFFHLFAQSIDLTILDFQRVEYLSDACVLLLDRDSCTAQCQSYWLCVLERIVNPVIQALQ